MVLVEVELDKILLVTIVEVAMTPLTVVVKVFPVADWVNELIIFVIAEVTPFTIL
jgi:hypothetical protein